MSALITTFARFAFASYFACAELVLRFQSILETSCGVLSQTRIKIERMEPRERAKFKLDDDYNAPEQPTLIPRCVKRVYG